VNNAPDQQVDLYRLRDDLRLDLNELIPAIEVAELLGFATVEAGDLALTALGETFAEASILARKEIFATRIRRLPLFQWMIRMLQASGSGWLSWDVFLAAMELDHPPDEAEHQLDTALDWGRYAELFGYDDAEGRVYLEQAEQSAAD
jgi:NitT/TauT family transport system ATP-binding protein